MTNFKPNMFPPDSSLKFDPKPDLHYPWDYGLKSINYLFWAN
jgi:hypothetical protein